MSPITTVPQITSPAEDGELSVLKVIEKKPNNNLIDLSSYESGEEKTNVRVSVLEAFDPLLIKVDGQFENINENNPGNIF